MKKSILFLAVAIVIISLSMTSYSKPEEHVVPCVSTYTLSCNLIKDMKKKYQDTQLRDINKYLYSVYPGEGDAKAVWLPLVTLKDFICYIEDNAGVIPVEDLGVRFYYAAYPKAVDFTKYPDISGTTGGVDLDYAERHTLILVPTQTDVSGIQEDLFLQGPSGFGLVPGIGDKTRPSKNHGSLFPPDPLRVTPCR